MDLAHAPTLAPPSAALTDQEVIGLLRQAFLYAKPEHAEAAATLTLAATIEELGIDSIAALEMSGFVEEQLDLQFPDDELVAIRSLGDLARLVRKYGPGRP